MSRGMDPALGNRLSAALAKRGLALVGVESEGHLVAGRSPKARMMAASAAQLSAKYVATGSADDADVDAYIRFAEDTATWGLHFATVRVLARR